MKHQAKLKLLAVTALVGLGLVGCGHSTTSSTPQSQTLNWMSTGTISTLDPSKGVDITTQQMLYNAFSGLVSPDGGNKVKLAVAKDYQVSNNGKTYTFHLKHTKWNNGQPLTANDFVYGIQRSANPKTASQEAYYMDHIVNYTEVSNGQKPVEQLGVKAIDNYTLQIQLTKPQPYFINILTLPVFYPQYQAAVTKYGSQYGTNSQRIVSNGAFNVTGWTGSNDAWTLQKNKDYYQASDTRLKHVHYTVIKTPQTALNEYQSGKLDETLLAGKQAYNTYRHNSDMHLRKSYTIKYITMNVNTVPALNNLKIRQALSQIINRSAMVNDILGDGSTIARGMVPDTLASRNGRDFNDDASVPSAIDYHEQSAKRLFKAGLKELHKANLSLTLTGGNDDTSRALAEFLQTEWEKLPGFHVNVQLLPNNVATSRFLHSQFQLHIAAWDPSISDPISPLNTKYTGNAMNTAKWHNAEYDHLIDKSNNEDALQPAKRWQDLVAAQKVLLQQQAIIPLYQTAQPELINSKVHGVRYFGNGPLWDFSHAYVK